MGEADQIGVQADDQRVGDARCDAGAPGRAGLIAPLGQVVADAVIAAPPYRAGGARRSVRADAVRRDPAIAFQIAPETVAGQDIGDVGQADRSARRPVDADRSTVVTEPHPPIADIIVAIPQPKIEPPVDQRRTEVSHGPLIAMIAAHRHRQCRGRRPAQRARQRDAVRPATIDIAVRPAIAGIHAVAQCRGQWSAQPGGGADTVLPAIADLGLAMGLCGGRTHHDIDRTAQRALPVEHRGRATQHIDPLDHPRVGREGDRPRRREQPHAVHQLQHRSLPRKAPSGQGRAAIARIGDARQAGRARLRLDDRQVAASADRPAIQRGDARGRLQRCQAQAAAGGVRRVERLFLPRADHQHGGIAPLLFGLLRSCVGRPPQKRRATPQAELDLPESVAIYHFIAHSVLSRTSRGLPIVAERPDALRAARRFPHSTGPPMRFRHLWRRSSEQT